MQQTKAGNRTYRHTTGYVDCNDQTETPGKTDGEPGIVFGKDFLGNRTTAKGDHDGSGQEFSQGLSVLYFLMSGIQPRRAGISMVAGRMMALAGRWVCESQATVERRTL